jgi:hypothetical protein
MELPRHLEIIEVKIHASYEHDQPQGPSDFRSACHEGATYRVAVAQKELKSGEDGTNFRLRDEHVGPVLAVCSAIYHT